jgi:CTP:molybdopterin cytidylyltransferase MocA
MSGPRPHGTKVAAIVLAAGEGRRIGGPKALLEVPPWQPAGAARVPLVSRILSVLSLGGVERPIVVTGAAAERVAPEVRAAGGEAVENPGWRSGQTWSLKAGLRALPPDAAAFLIHPVDHAFTRPEDVRALLDAWRLHADPAHAILRPVHAGRDFGHPVLFAAGYAPEFLALDDGVPANTIYRRHRDRVLVVPVDNPLIAKDLDTPADLEAFGLPTAG